MRLDLSEAWYAMRLDLSEAWYAVLRDSCDSAAAAVEDYCTTHGLAFLTAPEILALIERAVEAQPWLCPKCWERTGQLVAASATAQKTCQACYLKGWKEGAP